MFKWEFADQKKAINWNLIIGSLVSFFLSYGIVDCVKCLLLIVSQWYGYFTSLFLIFLSLSISFSLFFRGEVVGRKCLKVRICACPKRDKEKEEKEAEKNTPNAPPKGKKRKVESSATPQNRSDSEDLTVYNFQVNLALNQSKVLNNN